MELELTDTDELTVSVSLKKIADRLGEEYILGDNPDPDFAYLAAIALETYGDNSYDIEDTLMEFIRNADLDQLDSQDCDDIEEMLRQ